MSAFVQQSPGDRLMPKSAAADGVDDNTVLTRPGVGDRQEDEHRLSDLLGH
jgi:hypothetical protein